MNQHFGTVDWALGGNIYEVNTRQYTAEGTFVAFGKHLPRLREMAKTFDTRTVTRTVDA